jgi:hypothetical protein
MRAQTITNTFSNGSLDLVANGVVGSGFDGVYLGFGDVPGGNNGGDGNGATLMANSLSPFTGFLTVQTVNSSWSGNGDDGFFAYNIVWGDFDAQLDVAGPFQNANYVFGGLLARAVSDGSGRPYNPTGTNGSENWMNITRFEEFSIPTQVRYASNGVDNQITVTNLFGSATDTNADVFLRITRTGDTFKFYDSATYGGPWTLEQTLSRPDLHGAAMQVGIEEATFTGNTPQEFFADFGIKGTNSIVNPAADPTGLAISAPLSSNAVKVSWTPANGSSGSLVVIRPNKPITQAPLYGFSYVGNPGYGAVTNLGGGEQVVYAGNSNSVTITNLGGSNNFYTVAVYSFSTNGPAISYDSHPAITNFNGPGALAAVNFTISPTNVPVNGVASATVTATYSSGDSYNVSSNSSFTVGDSTVIQVQNGAITGLKAGTSLLTVSYQGVAGTNTVAVHAPAFSDNFAIPHNYLSSGLPGTGWEGIYLNYGDHPGTALDGDGKAATLDCDADLSTNNMLTVQAKSTTWAGTGDDGFFLQKYVTGDFQMAVHITNMSRANYQFAGLMARAFNNSGTAGVQGGPFNPQGGGSSENWIYWGEFGEFGDSTEARFATNGADNELANFDGDNADNFWLLMQRSSATNFFFYRKVNASDPWALQSAQTIVRPDFSNSVPLQVGIFEAMYTSATGVAQFDNFMLDSANVDSGGPPPSACSNLTLTLNPDFSITLNWVQGTNADNSLSTSFVVGRDGAPINQQPPYGFLSTANAQFGQGTDLGGGNFVLFRAATNTCSVTGLKPGETYYFAVYSYSGSGSSKVFNTETAAAGSIQDGNPTNIIASLPVSSIPSFGVGIPNVNLVFSGNVINPGNVAQFTTLTSANPAVAVATNGVISGVGPGSTAVQVVFAVGTNRFTNSINVTVRAPTFTDNFTNAHDYLQNGVTNTAWDGVYAYPNSKVPSTGYVSAAGAAVFGADAGITTNGTLTVSNENIGWEFAQDDGFFLYKKVPGDFQMQVHVVNFNAFSNDLASAGSANYDNPGLMARLFTADTNGASGAPFVATVGTNGLTTYGEDWVSWTRFDQFGIGTYARAEINGAKVISSTQPDPNDRQFWLLLVRQNGTNFYFYQKANQTDPWLPAPNGITYANAAYANQTMQVGIIACAFNSGLVQVDQFDHFALDVTSSLALSISNAARSIVLTWPAQANAQLQTTARLSPPVQWQALTNPAPVITNGQATLTLPIGAQNAFFRLSAPAQ